MYGMTGYSNKETNIENVNIYTEIKSVNSRFLDIIVNVPYYLNSLEVKIREFIKKHVNRGKIDVNVSLKLLNKTYSVEPNLEIAEEYIKSFRQIIDHFQLKDDVRLFHLTKYEDIFHVEKPKDYGQYWDIISQSLEENIKEILKMRKMEGDALQKDLKDLIKKISQNVEIIEKKVPIMEKEIYNNMKEKIEELIGQMTDEVKLLNEVAFLVNRSCINEEIIRLKAHIEHFTTVISEDDSIGKKLDFICQEMHREINTIGSKVTLVELTNNVVSVKNDIEKIREQLRNIE